MLTLKSLILSALKIWGYWLAGSVAVIGLICVAALVWPWGKE